MAIPSIEDERSISLEEMIALADEMAALVRAGVPLEQGMLDAAQEVSTRSGKLAIEIARRMQSGESLPHILSSSPGMFPPAYRAVIEAGARTGRLSAALEGLASSARRAADLRRMTRAAILYPLAVALLAYGLFVLSVTHFQPLVYEAYASFDVPTSGLNRWLLHIGESAAWWGPALPIVLLLPLAIWWHRSGRAVRPQGRVAEWLFPTARLIGYGRIATFADVLALLVEHQEPLGSAVRLAADASGDAGLSRAARSLAAEIERGGSAGVEQAVADGCPPILAWLLASGSNQPRLAELLRRVSESYRYRAERLDDRLRLYLPLGLTVLVGGTTVILYAISVLWPWYGLLLEMPSFS